MSRLSALKSASGRSLCAQAPVLLEHVSDKDENSLLTFLSDQATLDLISSDKSILDRSSSIFTMCSIPNFLNVNKNPFLCPFKRKNQH